MPTFLPALMGIVDFFSCKLLFTTGTVFLRAFNGLEEIIISEARISTPNLGRDKRCFELLGTCLLAVQGHSQYYPIRRLVYRSSSNRRERFEIFVSFSMLRILHKGICAITKVSMNSVIKTLRKKWS